LGICSVEKVVFWGRTFMDHNLLQSPQRVVCRSLIFKLATYRLTVQSFCFSTAEVADDERLMEVDQSVESVFTQVSRFCVNLTELASTSAADLICLYGHLTKNLLDECSPSSNSAAELTDQYCGSLTTFVQ